MFRYAFGPFAGISLLLAACQSTGNAYDRPARIIDPDRDSRAALGSAVNQSLGVSVTLSDSALTDSSLLVIENWPRPTIENPLPQGRIMDAPIQFRLVRNGEDCVLVNLQDRSRYLLANTRCEIE